MDQFAWECDRRSALLWAIAGAAVVASGHTSTARAEETKELAPGVKLKVLKEADTMIPGVSKVRLMEITFEPGSKLGPTTMKNAMVCEITNAPLEQHIEGMSSTTLQPGDIYSCHPGMVETDVNSGTSPCIMRVFELVSA